MKFITRSFHGRINVRHKSNTRHRLIHHYHHTIFIVPLVSYQASFQIIHQVFFILNPSVAVSLLKPENKGTLTTVLTYHVLAGKYTYNDVAAAIKKGNGKATMKTVQGKELTFMMNGMHNITIADAAGNTANISTYDVMQSNGVIHSIDTVLLPK